MPLCLSSWIRPRSYSHARVLGHHTELKGEDPLWWAGSPYDSGSSPDPPDSWSNSKQGGIQAYANGTAVAFSGPRAMVAGESISYVFSLMVTPVRPFDLKERFQERWAQLSGPSNYSHLADAGVTVVNMHQGNEINVREIFLPLFCASVHSRLGVGML
jgi:hypothetical protein